MFFVLWKIREIRETGTARTNLVREGVRLCSALPVNAFSVTKGGVRVLVTIYQELWKRDRNRK